MLRVDGIGYVAKRHQGHQEIHIKFVGIRVENILYFFKLKFVGKHGRGMLKVVGKAFKTCF
jgi:hypothetical protein